MSAREQRHGTASSPVRFLAEIVVLALLVAAVAAYRFDLGERWFGWRPDPVTQPAAVAPPEGLQLPDSGKARVVAAAPRVVAADPTRVAAAVQPLLRKRVLGPHVGVLVTDLSNGRAVFGSGATTITPASTTKLLTTTAALHSLGPMARFKTTVRFVPRSRQLLLVGGGDPFLSGKPGTSSTSYPDRADLVTLAQQTARRLKAMKVPRVRLGYDDSYFSGPAVNPAWPGTYLPEGVVPPISALWADEGLDPDGYGYLSDPAAGAAKQFRTALQGAGVKVGPQIRRMATPANAAEVTSVSSAPLGEIVERTLEVSDNQAAEVLARQVGLAERQEGSFRAGTAAVLEVLRRLGVRTAGDRLYDGSGLSRQDRLSTRTLAGVVGLATSPDHPELRHVLTGLPVAGFTGSLSYRFDKGPDAARGRVRAKTGTLTGVHGLAGVADDASGARMAFVIVADRVRPLKNLEAQTLIDRIAGALGACTCGVGSRS